MPRGTRVVEVRLAPLQVLRARALLLPFPFTAAMVASRVRRPGGIERLAAIFGEAASAIRSARERRRAQRLPALPLIVVASNTAALDVAGFEFPWAYDRDGMPPAGVLRIGPELRYRSTRSLSAGRPPFGYVASAFERAASGHLRLKAALQRADAKTYIGATDTGRGGEAALELAGPRILLAPCRWPDLTQDLTEASLLARFPPLQAPARS